MSVVLHLLGEPFIERDNVRFLIPLRKAEALLFYIAMEGRISREKLKFLFWGDKEEGQASNNLRNTIYLLKKTLRESFVVDRRHVFLDHFEKDIDAIPDIADPEKPIRAIFFEEPLRGLDRLGLPEFDEWLVLTRNAVKKRIADTIRVRVVACYERELMEELMNSLQNLLLFDPLDEDSVLELMEAYANRGYTAKVVSLYQTFRERMKSEIGISPSERAEAYFKRFIVPGNKQTEVAGHPGEFFCCREAEVKKILDLVSQGKNNTLFFFVYGEAGVGKTALVNRVVELLFAENANIFAARPYSVGEKYPYSSWNSLVSQIGKKLEERQVVVETSTNSVLSGVFHDFMKKKSSPRPFGAALTSERNPVTIGKMLADLVVGLSGETPPVFIFEDLHWFDTQSLHLLRAFLSEIRIPLTIFLTSRPENVLSVTELLYGLRTPIPYKFTQIQLTPFGAEETMHFCRAFLPEEVISRRGEDYFFGQSEGMPLLLVEMLKILSDNPDADCSAGLKGVIMSRMEELSPLQREVLSVLSVFGRGASVEDIASVMTLRPQDLIEPVEELLRKKRIGETREKDAFLIDFFHANVRECVYDAIPGFKKRDLHCAIAKALRVRFSPQVWNPVLSSTLCHHYTMAGLRGKALNQHLQEMSFHIALNHILFPMIQDHVLLSCSIPFSSREDTEYKVDQVRNLLHEINSSGDDTEIVDNRRMEASYLEIWGGYLINWGKYREGRIFIDRALKLARTYNFDEICMHCVEHIGHHCLQTDNAPRLLAAGREILHLAKRMGKENYVGLALRFIGMSNLLDQNFERAEKIFWHSIRLFEELSLMGRNYTLNLLASRCYIGEMHQWTGDIDGAMAHFEYCIGRCSDAGLFWGRSHFHAHAADVAYDMGDWDLACRHIDAGVTLLESCEGGYCGSILYSLKAIQDARMGDAHSALVSLEEGERLSAIGKKTWRAAQFMAKAWIAGMMEAGDLERDMLASSLSEPSYRYARAAESLYREIGATGRASSIREKFLSC